MLTGKKLLSNRRKKIMASVGKKFNIIHFLLIFYATIYNGKSMPNPGSLQALSCNFEVDLCDWALVNHSGLSGWHRTRDCNVEPGTDHTSLQVPKPAESGTWLAAYQPRPSTTFDLGYLQSQHSLSGSRPYCLSFWYYYYGYEVGQLAVFMSNQTGAEHLSVPLWARSIPQTRDWQQAFVELTVQPEDYYLTIRSMVTGHIVAGLDDIVLSNGTCNIDTIRFCDFEVNTCNWANVSGDLHREQGEYGLPDHTTGTARGHVLLDSHGASAIRRDLNGLPFRQAGRHARKRPFCLSLYYHMHAKQPLDDQRGYLSVSLVDSITPRVTVDTLKTLSLVDALNYGLTDQWHELRVDFTTFKWEWLHIEVNRSVERTVIALDDIRISENPCQVQGRCDFENDMCGWSNDYEPREQDRNAFLWVRMHARSNSTEQTLLPYDHTVGSQGTGGNYLLLPLQVLQHRYTSLLSPLIARQADTFCLQMYYFAQSNSPATVAMKLSLVNPSTNKTISEAAIKTTETLAWTLFEFQVSHHPPPYYYFVIKPQYSAQLQSDLGLDDINIAKGPCRTVNQSTTTTAVPPLQKFLDCNFENATNCHWSWSNTVWNVTNYRNSIHLEKLGFYAPRADHTYQSDFGQYLMLMPTSHFASPNKIFIDSTDAIKSSTPHCLHLWYYADGEYPFMINISIINTVDQYQNIAQYLSNMENRVWKLLRVEMMYDPGAPEITPDYRIHIEINAANSSERLELLAVDDITVHPGHCEHEHNYVYTFSQMLGVEDLELEHIQPLRSNVSQVYQPQSGQLAQVPRIDHTTRTADGSYYLFMNGNNGYPTVYIDTLTMQGLPSDHSYSCIRFAYQAQGEALFRVFVEQENNFNDNGVKMFEHKYPRDQWTVVEVNKQIGYEHKIIYHFEKSYDNSSFVVLDDVEILDYECQAPIDCDFQNNRYCSYSPFYDFKNFWYNFEVFTTPSEDPNFPGPMLDHTVGRYGGGYLLFSAYRFARSPQELKAKVISGPRLIKPWESYCLSLWIQVTSEDAKLDVSIVRYGKGWTDSNRTHSIVEHSNARHTKWTLWEQTLDSTLLARTYELQVSIEGWLEANSTGAIAIDDIVLTKGVCDNSGIICPDGKPVPSSKICNFHWDCSSGEDEVGCGECKFETNECGWNDTNARWNDHWVRVMASEEANHTANAPRSDADHNHTGHYLMMRQELQATQAHAELALNAQNPRMYLKQAYATCQVTFDYYVNTSGQFYIQVKLGSDVTDLNTVFTVAESRQGSWLGARAHIGEQRSQFILDIDAYQEDPSGVVALDNFQFKNCDTIEPVQQKCRTPTPIQCPNTFICINEDDLCDGVNHCGNEWDEAAQQCSNRIEMCPFNSLFACHITTDQDSDDRNRATHWAVAQAKSFQQLEMNFGFEPLIDHTSGTRFGYYILLTPQAPAPYTATFYSPAVFSSSNQQCSLRFFYYFHSKEAQSSNIRLNVKIRYFGQKLPEAKPSLSWQSTAENQQQWLKGVAHFGSSKPFQFILEGLQPDPLSRLAIDDFSYGANCHLYQESHTYETTKSSVHKPKLGNSPKAVQVIVAGVLVTLFLITIAAGSYALCRRHRTRLQTTSPWTLSMRNIEKRLVN